MIRFIELYHIVLIPAQSACPAIIIFYKLRVSLLSIRKSCLSVMKTDFTIHKLDRENYICQNEIIAVWQSRS